MATKKYRDINREKIRDYDKKYYRENRERLLKQRNLYYETKGWARRKSTNKSYYRIQKIIGFLED